jgi:hypothetical protein
VFPDTVVQTCIVHLIRYAMQFASWKERKAIAKDLRPIYAAPGAEALDAFEEGPWGQKYSPIVASWRRKWEQVIPFIRVFARGPQDALHHQRHLWLRGKAAGRYKATTNSNHDLPVASNLLEQDFTAPAPNCKWVSGITYIATDEGWLYVAVVLDLYSRLVVGWAMSERMTAQLVCDALRMAMWRRKMPTGVIVHSDRVGSV